MGFYHPETIVKDAQRHGLRVLPVDIHRSEWPCVPEGEPERPVLRLGFNYIRGMREPVAEAIVRKRARQPFASVADLVRRVPELPKDTLRRLAHTGALNPLASHRRDALWQAEWAARPVGPLLAPLEAAAGQSPLQEMTPLERTYADFQSVGVTVGRPPIAHYRDQLNAMGITRAADLRKVPSGKRVRIAGAVICRQRPETAKGFSFYSLEDETGIANGIVQPKDFDANRVVLTREPYLLMEGPLEKHRATISVRVERVEALRLGPATAPSHDFC